MYYNCLEWIVIVTVATVAIRIIFNIDTIVIIIAIGVIVTIGSII